MPESSNRRKNGKVVAGRAPVQPSKRDTFIKEANDVKMTCIGLIRSTANVKELIKAAHESPEVTLDEEAVGKLANTLARDLNALQIELNNIDKECTAEINGITKKTDDIDVMNITVNVASRYQQWQDRFVNVTGPTLEQITELCAGNIEE